MAIRDHRSDDRRGQAQVLCAVSEFAEVGSLYGVHRECLLSNQGDYRSGGTGVSLCDQPGRAREVAASY